MNRSNYYNYIEEKINTLATRINTRGKQNILDLNIHSENFYAFFLGELFQWELKNANSTSQNIEGIDLIDHTKKFVVQVSSTNTKAKVESSLNKDLINQYKNYTFKFISIANDADNLRGMIFSNPHGIKFDPLSDIIDKKSILGSILGMKIDDLRRIYDFIQKELGQSVDIIKLDTILASVINILAKENWDGVIKEQIIPFNIESKIDYNNLGKTKRIIDDYKIYHGRIEAIYDEYDSQGSNRSYAVLQFIQKYYIEELSLSDDTNIVFSNISKRIFKKVEESGNFIKIEIETLSLCVDILVVDAFIRCKIFENPNN